MISYKSITCIGDREVNEDSIVCVEKNGNYCFVVADGLGGHGKGDVASNIVVEVFKKEFLDCTEGTEYFLEKAFTSTQNEIINKQIELSAKHEMKTTAVALSIINGICQWGHIGDSRLYVFFKNKVKTRTLDHSVPQMLVLSHEIKEKQIRYHLDRNKLLRVLGIEGESPHYDTSEQFPIDKCQAFLLCSDGFWELINEKYMTKFLKKSHNVSEWLDFMQAEVEKNAIGKDMDNYSAIAVLC